MNRQDLKTIIYAEKTKDETNKYKHKICVCCGAGCISSGSEEVMKKLQEEINTRGLENEVEVIPTGCMGPCNQGPRMKFLPEYNIYQKVYCSNITAIVQSQLIDKKPIEDLLLFADSREKPFINAQEDPFFKKQLKIALKNCGHINPERIEDYLVHNGYQALDKALFEMSPEEVIAEVKQSRAGKSAFNRLMKEHHIRRGSISKYCFGIASMFRDLRANNFKEQIKKITQTTYATAAGFK